MTWGGAARGKYHFCHPGLNQMLTEQFGGNTPDDTDYCISAAQRMTELKNSNGW